MNSNTVSPATTTHLVYRPDVDGLRAVAVVAVVLYHAGFASFSGGFVGVDVFFVISGYLITSLILPDITNGTFTLRSFYERRIRRLFPALFAVLTISSVFALWLLMPQELEDYGESVATATLFTSNFLFYTEHGYFDGPAELKPLIHTWSLAIEEQFYILFPPFLLALRNRPRRVLVQTTAALLVASFVLSAWQTGQQPAAGFYLLPSRAWELLLGSLLALGALPTPAGARISTLMAWAGLLLVGAAIVFIDRSTPFPGLAALLPCAGTALIIHAGARHRGSANKLLSARPVVFIGLISYSLYLWHWPVFVFAKHYLVRELTTLESLLLIAAAVLVSVASWRYIERPFRGSRGLLSQRRLFRIAFASAAALALFGIVSDQTNGLPQRLHPDIALVVNVDSLAARFDDACGGISPSELQLARLCTIGPPSVEPSFVVWGDSHAATNLAAIEPWANASRRRGIVAVQNGCAPLLDTGRVVYDPNRPCREFAAAMMELISRHPQIALVVLSARWAWHAEGVPYKRESGSPVYLQDTHARADNSQENRTVFRRGLERTVQALTSLGRDVTFIGSVPEIGWDVPNTYAKSARFGRSLAFEPTVAEFRERQRTVDEVFADLVRRYRVRLLPVHQRFCSGKSTGKRSNTSSDKSSDKRCRAIEDGYLLYIDGDHLSLRGTKKLEPALRTLFLAPSGTDRALERVKVR